MSPRRVGYGSPPEHSRFPKGTSGNPKGRPRRSPDALANAIRDSIEEETTYREGRRTRKKPRWFALLKKHVQDACAGDLGGAEAVIRLRDQYRRESAAVPVIVIEDLLPADMPEVPGSGFSDADGGTGDAAASANGIMWKGQDEK